MMHRIYILTKGSSFFPFIPQNKNKIYNTMNASFHLLMNFLMLIKNVSEISSIMSYGKN